MADREPDALRGGLERVLLIEGQIPAALKVVDSDYDFVPAWITYAGMALALLAVLVLAYSVVIRFLI